MSVPSISVEDQVVIYPLRVSSDLPEPAHNDIHIAPTSETSNDAHFTG